MEDGAYLHHPVPGARPTVTLWLHIWSNGPP